MDFRVCVFSHSYYKKMKDSTKFIDLDVDDVFSSYELFFPSPDNIFIYQFSIAHILLFPSLFFIHTKNAKNVNEEIKIDFEVWHVSYIEMICFTLAIFFLVSFKCVNRKKRVKCEIHQHRRLNALLTYRHTHCGYA